MPFRILRESPLEIEDKTSKVEELIKGGYWSEKITRNELIAGLLEFFVVIPILITGIYIVVKCVIILNVRYTINIIGCFLNIGLLGIIGIGILFLIMYYRRLLTLIYFSCIKIKFYHLKDNNTTKEVKNLLNQYIRIEWDY